MKSSRSSIQRLLQIIKKIELNSHIIYPHNNLGRTGNRFKQIVKLFEWENLLNQSRISIPDTPERNESFNTTTFFADTPPNRNVDSNISSYSVKDNPITDATITITSLIQDHVNRHTQALINNREILVNIQPEIQTNNPLDQLIHPYIQTYSP